MPQSIRDYPWDVILAAMVDLKADAAEGDEGAEERLAALMDELAGGGDEEVGGVDDD